MTDSESVDGPAGVEPAATEHAAAEPDAQPETTATQPSTQPADQLAAVDLDAIERDLAAVETALARLSDGTYWTDEVTGGPIAEHVLAADPTTRRA